MITLVFSDESGAYETKRSEGFLLSHPFYVRANVLIPAENYRDIENIVSRLKNSIGIDSTSEIKWSHYGNMIKNRPDQHLSALTVMDIRSFYENLVKEICGIKGLSVFYTLTDNRVARNIEDIKMLRMHLQNAYQRAHLHSQDNNGYSIVIADELNNKTKRLKEAVYRLTSEGDAYLNYENVYKGLLVECSNQSAGLQVADICAGIFAASLKYIDAIRENQHKFEWAYGLFSEYLYKKVRHSDTHLPSYNVYRYGVKEVPDNSGAEIARKISRLVEARKERDLMISINEM